MSKDTPEVGDVWERNKDKVRVYVNYLYGTDPDNNERIYGVYYDSRIHTLEIMYVYERSLKSNYSYLGKSKANIEDLFKTENEE